MDRDSNAQRARRNIPLNPLRAFETAARHFNFTQAAAELGVTQGAVRRSVRVLEDYMGERLYKRCGDVLHLTERSGVLAIRLTEIFTRLAKAMMDFCGENDTSLLTIRTYPSFLTGFLLPNLVTFQAEYPALGLRLISASDSIEFVRPEEDVRIRYGRGRWRGAESMLLFHDQLRPVCSPKLLDPAKRPYSPHVLNNLVLLHEKRCRSDWQDWLAHAGCEKLEPNNYLAFEETSVAYQAAISGKGIVLTQKRYFARELSNGQLFEPFDTVLDRKLGFYLTIPYHFREAPKVVTFKNWLSQACHGHDLHRSAPVIPKIRNTGNTNERISETATINPL